MNDLQQVGKSGQWHEYRIPEPLLNDQEAAKFLGGLHSKTVQRMARRGELPHYRVGKYYRYRATELSDWLVLHSSGQINPPASTRKETIQ